MAWNPQEELLSELRVTLGRGAIRVTNDFEEYASILSGHFPFPMNRIDWSQVPNHRFLSPGPRFKEEEKNPEAYYARCSGRIAAFVKDCFLAENISLQLELIWLGDSMSDAFRMSCESFLTWSHILLSYPQHSYLFPEDATWCLNYTFEDETYFGEAPKAHWKPGARRVA